MKRRCAVLLCGSAIAVLVVGVLLWTTRPPETAITRNNAAKIRKGMAEEEVQAILGGPPRLEMTGRPVDVDDAAVSPRTATIWLKGASDLTVHHWASDEVQVSVAFGTDGRAFLISVIPVCPTPESIFEMVYRSLSLER